jgi:mRNA interferase MazF
LKRGDLYRVFKGSKHDPKNYRIFAVVSRQALLDSNFSTVICAPVYSNYLGLSTQIPLDIEDGLKHNSCIYCDELISIPKSLLSDYVGSLSKIKLLELDEALKIALAVESDFAAY